MVDDYNEADLVRSAKEVWRDSEVFLSFQRAMADGELSPEVLYYVVGLSADQALLLADRLPEPCETWERNYAMAAAEIVADTLGLVDSEVGELVPVPRPERIHFLSRKRQLSVADKRSPALDRLQPLNDRRTHVIAIRHPLRAGLS